MACAACKVGTYSTGGQSTCSSCYSDTDSLLHTQNSSAFVACPTSPLPRVTSTPILSTTASLLPPNVTYLFQFKVQYQLSEITEDIRSKMALAIANVLAIEAVRVDLSFVAVQLRLGTRDLLQQTGVLVNVGIRDLRASEQLIISRLTSDSINLNMHAVGLKSVQIITASVSSETTGLFPLDFDFAEIFVISSFNAEKGCPIMKKIEI